jgi:sugar/nucleoside kinase (ribokinase family)
MAREHSVGIAGPTYLDRTLRVNGVLSLDGSRQIIEDYTTPGGTGLSYAIAIARLGNRAELFSAIGDDTDALLILESIANEPNLEASWQQKVGKTDHAMILIDEGNHKCVASSKQQSNLWLPDAVFEVRCTEKDAVIFTSFANQLVLSALIKIAKSGQSKPFVMWAPHHSNTQQAAELLPVIDQIDHITLSQEEYDELSQAVGSPTELGVNSVTVTSGKNGVVLLRAGQPAEKIEPIACIEDPLDTNGAGEAFGSAYLSAFLQTGDHIKAALTGSFMGAKHVMRRGSDFPTTNVGQLLQEASHYDNKEYREFLNDKLQTE